MELLDKIKDMFSGNKEITYGDVLAEVKTRKPELASIEDSRLASSLADKFPDKFGYMKDFSPDTVVPPQFVPKSMRTESFYKANPMEGTKEALATIEQVKSQYPKLKAVSAQELAGKLETKFPQLFGGLSRKLTGYTKENAEEANKKAAVLSAVGEAPNTVEKFIVDQFMQTPNDTAVGPIPAPVFKDAVVAGVSELHGAVKALTGIDWPIQESTMKLALDRKVSPEIASMAGQTAGGIALMAGMNAAIGGEKMAASIGGALYKNPAIARFVAPGVVGGISFGASSAYHEAIRQIYNRKMDLSQFGHLVLKDTVIGALSMGAMSGPLNPLTRIAGSAAVGATTTLASGGSKTDAIINGAIMAGFAALSSEDITKAQQSGAIGAMRQNIRGAVRAEAEARGLTDPIAVKDIESQIDAGLMGEFKARGGFDKFKVKDVEGAINNVTTAVNKLMEGITPPAKATPPLVESAPPSMDNAIVPYNPPRSPETPTIQPPSIGPAIPEGKSKTIVPFEIAKSGDVVSQAENGVMDVMVKRSIDNRNEAKDIATEVGGTVRIEGPRLFAVVKSVRPGEDMAPLEKFLDENKNPVERISESLRDEAVASHREERQRFDQWKEIIGRGIAAPKVIGGGRDVLGEYNTLPVFVKNNNGEPMDIAAEKAVEAGLIQDPKDFIHAVRSLRSPKEPSNNPKDYLDEARRQHEYDKQEGVTSYPINTMNMEPVPFEARANYGVQRGRGNEATDQPLEPSSSVLQETQPAESTRKEVNPSVGEPQRSLFPASRHPSVESISREPDYVKITSDAEKVARHYSPLAENSVSRTDAERARDYLHGVMHQASAALRSKDTPLFESIVAKHPDLQNEFTAIMAKLNVDAYGSKYFDKYHRGNVQDQHRPRMAMEETARYGIESPVYYSQLQRTIEQKMPNSAPVSMVKALIEPNKGNVKAEEVEWSGINEFLKGKEKVSKAELLDFLKSNEVQIKEVVKQGFETPSSLSIGNVYDPGQMPNTKFSSYQLPGGSNYREVLLTLPNKSTSWPSEGYRRVKVFTSDGLSSTVHATEPQIEMMKRSGRRVEILGPVILKDDSANFYSSHFDEPNILAHVRMNDRTTADGKRVLFLEEVQSDWMQKGRTEGFRGEPKYYVAKSNETSGRWSENFDTRQEAENYAKTLTGQFEVRTTKNENGVPNAPFKKTWHELAIKRILRYAVDNGYDGIAWTTGEQQVERYDLSQQLSEVEATKIGPNSFNIIARNNVTRGGVGRKVIEQIFDSEELPDVVGKDLANKIIVGGGGKYSGLDLKVGGEGMKGFYDQMIPSFLNKYTKKWGGRVGQSEISQIAGKPNKENFPEALTKVHSLDITPAMRESIYRGQSLFEPKASFGNSRPMQQDFFGGAAPVSKPKNQADTGQMPLFGQKAQPKFEVPKQSITEYNKGEAKGAENEKQVDLPDTGRSSVYGITGTAPMELRYKKEGSLTFAGNKIRGPEDIAFAFRSLKNQAVEHLYAVGTKNGELVSIELVSIGSINQTTASPFEIVGLLRQKGADSFYIVHNHPSGNPEPSKEDHSLFTELNLGLGRVGLNFMGGVVIDDTQYSWIPYDDIGKHTLHTYPGMEGKKTVEVDALKKYAEWSGPKERPIKIKKPEDVYDIVKGSQASKDSMTVVLMNNTNSVMGIATMPKNSNTNLRSIVDLATRWRSNGIIIAMPMDLKGETGFRSGLFYGLRGVGIRLFDVIHVGEQENHFWSWKEDGAIPGNAREKLPSYMAKDPHEGLISESIYSQNRDVAKLSPFEGVGSFLKSSKEQLEKLLTPISSVLADIDPSLRIAIRRNAYRELIAVSNDAKAIHPFLEKAAHMPKGEYADLDLALKNGDKLKIRSIVQRFGMESDYANARTVLDNLHARAKVVGYDVGYLKDYWPRMVKDKEGFLRAIGKSDQWPDIETLMQVESEKAGRPLTEDEKVALINKYLRGYMSGVIALSRTPNMKGREIPVIDALLNRFYRDSKDAALRYIKETNHAIEARRFFGKGSPDLYVDNLDASIGQYVSDLAQKNVVKNPSDERKIKNILSAYFNQKSMHGALAAYKDFTVVSTLGNFISALTQLQDLGVSIYRAPTETVAALGKALIGGSDIKLKDIGLEIIAEELKDSRKSAMLVSKFLRWGGLELMDRLTAEPLINGVISRYRKQAINPDQEFIDRIKNLVGSDYDQAILDLKSGKTTDLVKFMAFSELLGTQPKALTEQPQTYLSSGNGRIFYALKTFQLRQIDMIRQEAFKQMGKPGLKAKAIGIRRLILLAISMMLAGIGSDQIKDILLGRKTSFSDRIADNLLKLVGLSKWTLYKARQEGIASAAMKQVLPPAPLVDQLWKDIRTAGDNKGLEVVNSIPLVGKFYYWWLGRGKDKKPLSDDMFWLKQNAGRLGLSHSTAYRAIGILKNRMNSAVSDKDRNAYRDKLFDAAKRLRTKAEGNFDRLSALEIKRKARKK